MEEGSPLDNVIIICLQEKHKLELEDLRRAGHEALAIIVEEFKVSVFAAIITFQVGLVICS